MEALAKLRDNAVEERVRLEAAKVLLAYSDGEPGAHNVPPEPEEAQEQGETVDVSPPPLSPELEAAISSPRPGGDAGSPGEGNGGGA